MRIGAVRVDHPHRAEDLGIRVDSHERDLCPIRRPARSQIHARRVGGYLPSARSIGRGGEQRVALPTQGRCRGRVDDLARWRERPRRCIRHAGADAGRDQQVHASHSQRHRFTCRECDEPCGRRKAVRTAAVVLPSPPPAAAGLRKACCEFFECGLVRRPEKQCRTASGGLSRIADPRLLFVTHTRLTRPPDGLIAADSCGAPPTCAGLRRQALKRKVRLGAVAVPLPRLTAPSGALRQPLVLPSDVLAEQDGAGPAQFQVLQATSRNHQIPIP